MFERDDWKPTPRELYPDAYHYAGLAPLEEPYTHGERKSWAELDSLDPAPKLDDPGVTLKVETGYLRYTICKGGEKWTKLKTPAVIRDVRRLKSSGN